CESETISPTRRPAPATPRVEAAPIGSPRRWQLMSRWNAGHSDRVAPSVQVPEPANPSPPGRTGRHNPEWWGRPTRPRRVGRRLAVGPGPLQELDDQVLHRDLAQRLGAARLWSRSTTSRRSSVSAACRASRSDLPFAGQSLMGGPSPHPNLVTKWPRKK